MKCDSVGACMCKRFVEGRRCTECQDGYFNLKERNYFGCEGCKCDVGGSKTLVCSKRDGQCLCRSNIGGRQCNRLETCIVY